MNIKIDRTKFDELTKTGIFNQYVVGSNLYKTEREDSDFDILVIVKGGTEDFELNKK